ncbi:MAG TPA: hypothetical protein VNI52_11245 [Sphingobacteriaceae bacterium]|nr:hypothetical protein [Sphingobacteriaceae bacterium]
MQKGKPMEQEKAEEIDYYLGEFREGLPNGRGVYRWKSGGIYEGSG